MSNTNVVRKLWMPIQKSSNGKYRGILSDNSTDRDDERMSSNLLKSWSMTKSLPALVDHKNSMKSLAGVWTNFKSFNKDNKTALFADLTFLKSNPHTAWMEALVKEAEELGHPVGISISAIPKKFKNKSMDKDGFRREWLEAELVEATLTPIPSNRNAYAVVAKSFGLDKAIEKSVKDNIEGDNMSEEVIKKEAPVESEVVEDEKVEEPVVESKSVDTKEFSEMKEMIKTLSDTVSILVKAKAEPEEEVKDDKKEDKKLNRQAELKAAYEEVVVKDAPTVISKKNFNLFDLQAASLGATELIR